MAHPYERLYRARILEQYQNPRYRGVVEDADFDVCLVNQLCGDSIRLTGKVVHVDGQRTLEMRFEAKGCVLSQASAATLLEHLEGWLVAEIQKITPQDVFALMQFEVGPTRRRCLLLVHEALQLGLTQLVDKELL